jgi:multimeric flavodoxin WrbA
MTKVVGLFGSPRRSGNTEKLLDRFLAGAADAGGQVHKILVVELGIEGWAPELECLDGAGDKAEDDYQGVSRKLLAADVVAVAAPVYFRNVPAQLKALIDRSQCQWIRKYVDRDPLPASSSGHETRRGVLISTGGNEREHFDGTIQTVKSFFDVYETGYWGELLFGGVDAKAEIEEEPLALQEAYDLGFRAVAETWE